MARPRKCRRICGLPINTDFGPRCVSEDEPVVMTMDEYETIRLIDLEGLQQEECAGQMNVARTTVQLIYNSARKKLAAVLVYGRDLRIEGGDVIVCDGSSECPRKHCGRRPCMLSDEKREKQ